MRRRELYEKLDKLNICHYQKKTLTEEIRMILSDFSEMCFSCPDSPLSAVIYVFDDEDDADNWLKDRYANAKVVFFHCVRKDVLAVVIYLSRQEKKDDVD